jgi:hypothetical protein
MPMIGSRGVPVSRIRPVLAELDAGCFEDSPRKI